MFMPAMDPKAQLHAVLAALDDQSAAQVLAEALRRRPELAPGVVGAAVPDLTYAPADALAKRRASGVVKSFSPQGFGFITCPELKAVFGHDVYVHKRQIGPFAPGSEVDFAVLLNKDLKPQAFDLQPGAGAGPGGPAGALGKDAWGKGAWGKGALGKGGGGQDGYGKGDWGKGGWGKDAWGKEGWGKGGWGKGGDWSGGWGDCGPAKRPKILSPDAKPDVQQVLGQFVGTIKSFNAKNGFGFIECEVLRQQGYQNDVYLHHCQVGEFQPGHTVIFTAYLNKKGQPQAMELQAGG